MRIKAHLIWVAFMFGILGLTGCTSLNTAAKARGSGEQVTYGVHVIGPGWLS